MNRFALLPLFLIFFLSLKAQDRIISTSNDTIQCKIVSIGSERILYELKEKNGFVTSKFIQLSQVSEYSRFSSTNKELKQPVKRRMNSTNVPEKVWTLRVNVGKSELPWYLDEVTSDYTTEAYYKKITTGFHINSNAIYWATNYLGVGIDYSFFHSSFYGSITNPYALSMYSLATEDFNQYFHFLGPTIQFKQYLDVKRKFFISESLSAGALLYRLEDQITYPIIEQNVYSDYSTNTLLTAFSLAAKIGLTAEYRLSRSLSVGMGADFLYGTLKKASIEVRDSKHNNTSLTNQELSKTMNISRLDYSFVLSYQF